MNYIAIFENAEAGMKSYVSAGVKGFHVSLQDTDSGEFTSYVQIFKSQDAAIAKAKEVMGQ